MTEYGIGGITAHEVREVWAGRLQPIADELIPPQTPPATRGFLAEVGLPTVEELGVEFVAGDTLSPPVRQEGREFLVLTAEGSVMPFAIELASGQAYGFHASAPAYTRFTNSDIAALLFFQGLLARTMSHLDDLDAQGRLNADVLADALDGIRAALRDRDPAAMEGRSPWKLLLDDLESQFE